MRPFKPVATEKDDAQIPGFNEEPTILFSCPDSRGFLSYVADPGGWGAVLVVKLTHAGATWVQPRLQTA